MYGYFTGKQLEARRKALMVGGYSIRYVQPNFQIPHEAYSFDIDLMPDRLRSIEPLFFRQEDHPYQQPSILGSTHQAVTLHLSLYQNSQQQNVDGITGINLETGKLERFSALLPPSTVHPPLPVIIFYDAVPASINVDSWSIFDGVPQNAIHIHYKLNESHILAPHIEDQFLEEMLQSGHMLEYNSLQREWYVRRVQPTVTKNFSAIYKTGSHTFRVRIIAMAQQIITVAPDGISPIFERSTLFFGFIAEQLSGAPIRGAGYFRSFTAQELVFSGIPS